MDDDKPVTIDVETATETATRPEDVDRVRREAGLEDGEAPPRGEPSGEDSEIGQARPRGSDRGEQPGDVDRALDAAARDTAQQPSGVPEGAARDDELPPRPSDA